MLPKMAYRGLRLGRVGSTALNGRSKGDRLFAAPEALVFARTQVLQMDLGLSIAIAVDNFEVNLVPIFSKQDGRQTDNIEAM